MLALDHVIVHSRNRRASAKRLAELLGVPWSGTGIGPFCPVYVSDSLTLDFDETDKPFPVGHFAFRVSQDRFDAILDRIKAAGIEYRSTPRGPTDSRVNHHMGGNMIYWNEPEGYIWEILTVSYARQSAAPTKAD